MTPPTSKGAKQAISRKIDEWKIIGKDSEEKFRKPWEFSENKEEAMQYIAINRLQVKDAINELKAMEEKVRSVERDALLEYRGNPDMMGELKTVLETHCEQLNFDDLCRSTFQQLRNLNQRLQELEMQELTIKVTCCVDEQNARYYTQNATMFSMPGTPTVKQETIPIQTTPQFGNGALGRRVCGREIKLPDFNGEPGEYETFWQLFEELVDKQHYSNFEKYSTLSSCCKGNAARALAMLDRTGDCYDEAKEKLKKQFKNQRVSNAVLGRQLKEMRQCSDESNDLVNHLNDVETIMSKLKRNGYVANDDTRFFVKEKFPPRIQKKLTKAETTAGTTLTADELIAQARLIIEKEQILKADTPCLIKEQKTRIYQVMARTEKCVGCSNDHLFGNCPTYNTWRLRRARLMELNLCHKCFSRRHKTGECERSNCKLCNHHHHIIVCKEFRQKDGNERVDDKHRSRNRERSYDRHKSRDTSKNSQYTDRSGRSRSNSYNPKSRHSSRSSYRADRSRSYSKDKAANKDSRTYSQRNSSNERKFERRESSKDRRPSDKRESSKDRKHSGKRDHSREKRNVKINVVNSQENGFSDEDEVPVEEFGTAIKINKVQCNARSARLMSVNVKVRNRKTGKLENLVAILDSAADESFLKESTAQRLGLKCIRSTPITITAFGGEARTASSNVIEVSLVNNESKTMKVTVLTTKELLAPYTSEQLTNKDIDYLKKKHVDINDITEMNDCEVDPDILLGIEDYNTATMQASKRCYKLPSGLCARDTFFGFTISGKVRDSERIRVNTARILPAIVSESGNSNRISLEDTWKLEAIGIKDDPDENSENAKVVQHFYDTVQIIDGVITVQFPWKENKDQLSDNYTLALSRLHQQYKLKEKDSKLWEKYCEVFEQQIKSGILEDVPKGNGQRKADKEEVPRYYMPHSCIVKLSSNTTKVRPVLDASSKKKGELSLNNVIFQGPVILPKLVGILIRARKGKICVISDVERAFHTIGLQELQRNAVLVIWLIDPNKPPTPDNIRVLRFTKLPFGVNCSPYLLAMAIKYGLEQGKDTELNRDIIRNLYVDNLVLTHDSENIAVETYKKSKEVFNSMTMNIREFVSNSKWCNDRFDSKDISKSANQKLLGIKWDFESDTLLITTKMNHKEKPTKRKVLQTVQATYDPQGWLIPLLLPAKIFQQDLWQSKYEWDSELSTEHQEKWKEICMAYNGYEVKIPRQMMQANKGKKLYELHTFVDASNRAYSTCVYLRTVEENGNIECKLINARYRLTPVKDLNTPTSVTMPKLELLALQMGFSLTEFVIQEIDEKIDSIKIYGDSKIALSWLFSTKKLGTFVTNRVEKCKTIWESWTDRNIPCKAHYVNTLVNPADCATRGLSTEEFENHIWWTGAPFLQMAESEWLESQTYDLSKDIKQEQDTENTVNQEKQEKLQQAKVNVASTNQTIKTSLVNELKDLNRNTRKLAIAMKFLKNLVRKKCTTTTQQILKSNINGWDGIETSSNTITAVEMVVAENILLRNMQRNITQEMRQQWNNLNLYTDANGLVRCKGRLGRTALPLDNRDPILLVPNHIISELIVKDIHKQIGHQGVNGTLANVRTKFWLPTGRRIITKLVRKCINCQMWNNKPFRQPESGDLPVERCLPATRPFENIGLDYDYL